MAAEEHECEECVEGAPGWIVTFADLMSLLLTFFILLLSFSEMEVTKFKKIAGSLKDAFGVQRVILEDTYPKGTSSFYQHYSPGQPSTLTMDNSQPTNIKDPKIEKMRKERQAREKKQFKENVAKIKSTLKNEIKKGDIEVETKGKDIIIRVPEKASFSSGSANLNKSFTKTLHKIAQTVKGISGSITISGHTDDRPISTNQYRSNWDLSSARAVSLAHSVMKMGKIKRDRLVVTGHADTRPVAPNRTPAGRAKNRRVEIVIGTDSSQ